MKHKGRKTWRKRLPLISEQEQAVITENSEMRTNMPKGSSQNKYKAIEISRST